MAKMTIRDALNTAIQDNIIGLTEEKAKKIRYLCQPESEVVVVVYEDKPIIACGIRRGLIQGADEFFIDVANTVTA